MPLPFHRAWPLLPFLLLPLLPPVYGQRTNNRPPTQDPFQRPEAPAAAVGSYQSHQYQNGILTIQSTDGGTLRVRPWTEGVVRIEYFPAGSPVQPDPSVSVVQVPGYPTATTAPAPQNLSGRLEWPLYTQEGSATIRVQKNPLRVSYWQDGRPLVEESGGMFQRQTNEASGPGGTGVQLRLQPEEHLYGTGSRALPLDRRGRRLSLYNEAHYGYRNGEPTLNATQPTVLSSRGYLLLFDHVSAATLDLGATDKNTLEYSGEDLLNLGYFIVAGRSQAEILDRYTALTGRQPLPPRWALGLIQSRFGYRTDTEMLQVARRMRRENFPLDGLVLDLYWFGGTSRQGDLTWDYDKFQQPVRTMRRLDSMGVKTILISEPYVMRTSRNDTDVRLRGLVGTHLDGSAYTVESFWAGPATILDMYRPETQDWLWTFYKRRKEEGVAGWWSDLGEPENHPLDMRHYKGSTRRIHNGFGQAWADIFQTKYSQEYRNDRVFNLVRSGWAGMQRNSVFPWSGDISRSWSGFQAQIPIMLSMSLGGVGYMHSDAGGFGAGPVDPELYTRWLQMASFSPIMRPHSGDVPPEGYWYPEPYKSIVRQAAHQRYELLPYLYSLAWENTRTGAPLTQPMSFVDNRPALADINDQFLLGPNLLVAPVLQPGQRRRNVSLPAGNWVDFYSHETLRGNQTVGRPAPLARVPLLVRAGAFLPLAPYVPTTADYSTDTLRVRYYADPTAGPTRFTVYDDDGKSALALTTEQYQLIEFRGLTTATQTDVTVSLGGRSFENAPAWRTVQLLVPRVAQAPAAVLIDGETLPPSEYHYDARAHTLALQFLLENKPVQVSVRGLRLNTAPVDAAPEALTLEAPDNRTVGGSVQLRYTRYQPGSSGPLRILNTQGQVVRTLPAATTTGPHTLTWNSDDTQGSPVAGGVYWAELAGQRQRLVVVRP